MVEENDRLERPCLVLEEEFLTLPNAGIQNGLDIQWKIYK
jgi:hypothetical protein